MKTIALVAALLPAQAVALTAQTLKPEAGYTGIRDLAICD